MSNYNPPRKSRLFAPQTDQKFKLSRSKLELFINCPRCFYLDRRLGIAQPPGYPFSLNNAVDNLLKIEFDEYRKKQQPHPLMIEYHIDAIPFQHPDMDKWRDALHGGVHTEVEGTNFIFTGGVDDIWIDSKTKELIVVDYKATSKKGPVTLDAEWQDGYRRQAEMYQWLLRQNGFEVTDTAYFVYCNGKGELNEFNNRLEFDVTVIPYSGNAEWVREALTKAYSCLQSTAIPKSSDDCDYCKYIQALDNIKS